MHQQLVLLRGLPGSGKSTLANALIGYVQYEADMFFMKDGEYKIDFTQMKFAHEWCQAQTMLALEEGKNVVVSNTFTQQWEMQWYRDLAAIKGYNLVVLIAKGEFDNDHGVPPEKVEIMRQRWED